ncbi:MAG: hypothetical protein ACRBB3_04940 [Alphaproteobacteria bacterium]
MLAYSFFTAYVISVTFLYLSNSKTMILALNFWACFFCGIYLVLTGGYAGVIACIAAGSASLYQLYTINYLSHISKRRVVLYKFLGSSIFALIGILAVYQNLSDLYLVIAIVLCRGGEMCPNQHQMKIGYTFAEALWMLYAADNDLIPLYIVHLIMTILGIFMLMRHYYPLLSKNKITKERNQ